MSGQHIGDLASSFVEMAKAYEELPKVKAELVEANRAFNHATDTIQRLELKLIDRNTTIDELHAKVREAEVARDDAELRFLEADEKLEHVAKALQAAGESVGLALRRPEPVVAEPTPEPGQSAVDPIAHTHESPTMHSEPPETKDGIVQSVEPFSPESKPSDPVEVREEANPSVASVEGVSTEAQIAAVQAVAEPLGQSDPLPTAASPIDGSTVGSTNANPSGDASSPIDDPSYANEPQDKWGPNWAIWAGRMDAKFGRYNWPMRTAQA